ncbi:MAG: creatininase family protein [Candidatus Dormibacteraeota bacterium]|uniref:Creatininase family protein n=1 Tax=Candidatus Dormiibacter inghamiae TaxID=3127013 RepID=A0A934KM03_9BACT|nr:creatininase family protein [Candidatus Dormibacteraeota bacterium]MBJ7606147.1 creatininase family protein [Candidatus Dormibacteraeota bacterium]
MALIWTSLRRSQLAELRDQRAVVLIPLGAVEQHGPHLPVGTDIVNAWHIANRVSAAATNPPVVVAPPVAWGISHYHAVFAGTISLRVETLSDLLLDLCNSIAAGGFARIVILNGHGGNQALIDTVALRASSTGVHVLPITYWNIVPAEMAAIAETDEGHIGHAGEMETSLQLHLNHDLVDRQALEGPLGRPIAEVGLLPGVYQVPRVLEEAPDGVYGLVHMASAEKGQRLVDAVVRRLGEVLSIEWPD